MVELYIIFAFRVSVTVSFWERWEEEVVVKTVTSLEGIDPLKVQLRIKLAVIPDIDVLKIGRTIAEPACQSLH
ncbi:MAG: hypothetical protein PHY29_07415 [Syntrophales bacterium]|nr:hypothetical protein [Syntrophales bacterium]